MFMLQRKILDALRLAIDKIFNMQNVLKFKHILKTYIRSCYITAIKILRNIVLPQYIVTFENHSITLHLQESVHFAHSKTSHFFVVY